MDNLAAGGTSSLSSSNIVRSKCIRMKTAINIRRISISYINIWYRKEVPALVGRCVAEVGLRWELRRDVTPASVLPRSFVGVRFDISILIFPTFYIFIGSKSDHYLPLLLTILTDWLMLLNTFHTCEWCQ